MTPTATARAYDITRDGQQIEFALNLAIQRELSAVPLGGPSTTLTYSFAPTLDAYVANDRLAPPDFWRGESLGRGTLAAYVGISYFDVNSPTFKVPSRDPLGETGTFHVSTDVLATSLFASYGLTSGTDIYLDLPLLYTDAQVHPSDVSGNVSPVSKLSPSVSSGFGVGRISVGTKLHLLELSWVKLVVNPEFFFPSPSSAELAGPPSGSFVPRTVASLPLSDFASAYGDAGYEVAFDTSKLSRFVWRAGVGCAWRIGSIDVGAVGSHYASSTAVGTTNLSQNYVDVVTGGNLRLADHWALLTSFGIPLGASDFRPTLLVTLGVGASF